MSDIDKIRLLHDVKNVFQLTEEELAKYISQIDSSAYRKNIQRFFSGYTVEDKFSRLYSSLPWVKLVHGLKESQLPIASKAEYQVPDHILIYETSARESKMLFVDVKRVKGHKKSLDVMEKQMLATKRYADVVGRPLLYAIFWEIVEGWTLNTPDQFEKKSRNLRIGFPKAFENDLSIALGDLTVMIPSLLRRSVFDPSITKPTGAYRPDYGAMIRDSVSLDGKNFIDLDMMESLAFDSIVSVTEISNRKIDQHIELIEKSKELYMPRLSVAASAVLATFPKRLSERAAGAAFFCARKLAEKLDLGQIYMLPSSKTASADALLKEAFEGTWVWNDYSKTQQSGAPTGLQPTRSLT